MKDYKFWILLILFTLGTGIAFVAEFKYHEFIGGGLLGAWYVEMFYKPRSNHDD